ncbi:hypothetical protein F5H01DRAFT_369432 [Linnemannia elongata]|nr:hypothetical protein F5H01DRAFT_369432 [Linnemannia elongata]
MFLTWSLFTINVILAVFQFLLIGAIGAILAIYSRFGGEYANSIRWTRQGGYLEMLNSLYNSWKSVPKSTKLAIVFTIFASLVASLADKGASYFITLTERQANASSIIVNTSQFVPVSEGILELSGWSTNIRYGADIVEAMTKMISDTKNIPEAVSGRVYTPQTSEYDIGCNQTAIIMESYYNTTQRSQLPLRNEGCASISLTFLAGSQQLSANATVINRSSDRWSIAMPIVAAQYLPQIDIVAVAFVNDSTLIATITRSGSLLVYHKDGITSLPQTVTSKGVSPTGETLVLSISNMPFCTLTAQRFRNVSTAIFDNYDDLFQAMEASVNNAAFRSKTNLFTEVRIVNSTIEALVCYSSSLLGLMCTYTIINSILVKQQDLNPIIAEARQGRPLSLEPDATISMTIDHTVAKINGTRQSISLSTMKNATTASAHYLASLGQNFYMDWNASQLYIIYDTTDTQRGVEIPLWLMMCISINMVACLGLWAATEYFMNGRYTSSLHKNIALHLGERVKSGAPMLMRSKFDPLEFQEVPILSRDIQHGVDAGQGNVLE